MSDVLTLRELNRATLARQMLLERADLTPLRAMERLGPLQGQYSPSPYVALWTRLAGFERADLTRLIERRAVVKSTLIRGTLHLTTSKEHSFYAAILAHYGERDWAEEAARAGLSPARLRAEVDGYLREPRSVDELQQFLNGLAKQPGRRYGIVRWQLIKAHGGLVHALPSGTWRAFGRARLLAARHAVRGHQPAEAPAAFRRIAQRYLAAYGPASRADLALWSGVPAGYWREALASLRLRVFRDEDGRELLDLPRAARPSADVAAPPRYLSKWDNMLIGFRNRERVFSTAHQKAIVGLNGDYPQIFMVDGLVAGTWATSRVRDEASLDVKPLVRIFRAARAALGEEGEALLRFIEPNATRYNVRV